MWGYVGTFGKDTYEPVSKHAAVAAAVALRRMKYFKKGRGISMSYCSPDGGY
jgi:hypothetical protein